MKFIAYDPADNEIWGVGETPSSAIVDAGRWINEFVGVHDGVAELQTMIATPELVERVDAEGSQCKWKIQGGVAQPV